MLFSDTLHIHNPFDITGELHQIPGLQLGDYAQNSISFNTMDLTTTKKFSLKRSSLALNLTAKNLLNSSYELVSGYPMPPRSLVGGGLS